MTEKPETTATDADRKALARFFVCADDGQGVDIGRPALDRLTAIGWLDKIGRGRWQMNGEGDAVLAQMESAMLAAAPGAKP